MPAPPSSEPRQRPSSPLGQSLRQTHRARVLGLTFDDAMRYFFGGNATLAIVILSLIMAFLFREGADFFPEYQRDLTLYRQSGAEYADILGGYLEGFREIHRRLETLRRSLENKPSSEQTTAALRILDTRNRVIEQTLSEMEPIHKKWVSHITEVKKQASVNAKLLKAREKLISIGEFKKANSLPIQEVSFDPIYKMLEKDTPGLLFLISKHRAEISKQINLSHGNALPGAFESRELMESASTLLNHGHHHLTSWKSDAPIPATSALTSFLFGKKWITNSFWQDWYGVVPLLTGSLLISVVALSVAVPISIAAAIYTNQFAGPRELHLIKPYIEFIQAIPSVVLGFFGIAVLGEIIRTVSGYPPLEWMAGFPIIERLNIFTAGLLLALMAVPTIFTLAEDALANVPRTYVEASLALGGSKLDTIYRVMLPTAASGIVSAVLLGFGRVIGETMVVLLCAGNRIQIPDFSLGLAALFEPAHTMTGIIAQEMGEVAPGTIHYRALFSVGILLFLIALMINFTSQRLLNRYKVPHA